MKSSLRLVYKNKFESIQVLRFVAAALVVMTHVSLVLTERLSVGASVWGNGGIGVPLFFVISGFVMVVSTSSLLMQNNWQEFVRRRVVRIVPIYWIATSLKLFSVLLLPALALHTTLDFYHIFSSYFLIPAWNGEGEIKTLHAVGWTLLYEAFFYFLFALSMRLRISSFVFCSTVFFCFIGVKAFFPELMTIAVVKAYSNPITLYFVAGMLIASFREKFERLPVLFGWGLLFVSLWLFLAGEAWALWRTISPVLMVGGGVVLERVVQGRIPRVFVVMGDASYSVYLFHPFVLVALGVLMRKLSFSNAMLAAIFMFLIVQVCGYMVFRWVEIPLMQRLKSTKLFKSVVTAS